MDGFADLSEFGNDEGIVAVAFRVVFDQDIECFLGTVLGNEPTGRFGDEPDEGDLEQGGDDLKQ